MVEKNFMYDENLDRLMIFNKLKEDEKVYGSVKILNLILDITTKNRIANIEIRNVSDYLKSMKKNFEILKTLTNASIIVQQIRGGFIMRVLLSGKNNSEEIPYSIPTKEEILITA